MAWARFFFHPRLQSSAAPRELEARTSEATFVLTKKERPMHPDACECIHVLQNKSLDHCASLTFPFFRLFFVRSISSLIATASETLTPHYLVHEPGPAGQLDPSISLRNPRFLLHVQTLSFASQLRP